MLVNWKNIRENPPPKWRTRILYHIGYNGFVTDGEYCRCPFPPYSPCISTGCGWVNLIDGEGDHGNQPIFWDNIPRPLSKEILKENSPEFIVRAALNETLVKIFNENENKEIVDIVIDFIEKLGPPSRTEPSIDNISDIGESTVVRFLRKSK